MNRKDRTILTLYPNQWGVSYALFENTDNLADCGVGYIQPANLSKAIKRLNRFLDYYNPTHVVLRGEDHLTNTRIKGIIKEFKRVAKKHGYGVESYSRKNIREAFAGNNAFSKYEISKELIRMFPQLEKYSIPKRKNWMSEHHRMGVFDAVSLGVTYYAGEDN